MRAIVDALVSATNLAMMIRDEGDADHSKAASRLLLKLERATERVVLLTEKEKP